MALSMRSSFGSAAPAKAPAGTGMSNIRAGSDRAGSDGLVPEARVVPAQHALRVQVGDRLLGEPAADRVTNPSRAADGGDSGFHSTPTCADNVTDRDGPDDGKHLPLVPRTSLAHPLLHPELGAA